MTATLWKELRMPSDHKAAASPSSRSSSSFEKFPRGSEEYPLEVLDPEGAPSRGSVDSEHDNDEPLLPTSVPHQGNDRNKKRFSWSKAGISSWAKGPSPPHKYHINPWFPRWQAAPGRLVNKYFPSKIAKIWLLLGIVVAWGIVFISTVHSTVSSVDIAGYGNPVKLSCHARLW